MEEENELLNKPVVVRLKNDFALYGLAQSFLQGGIFLKTKTETSFISFTEIKNIRLDRRGD